MGGGGMDVSERSTCWLEILVGWETREREKRTERETHRERDREKDIERDSGR